MSQLKQYILEQVAEHKLPLDEAKQLLEEIKNVSTQSSRTSDDIAIIGMAARFPQAKNVEEFWNNIVKGINCISTPGSDRRDEWETFLQAYFNLDEITDEMLAPGGYLDDVNKFDSEFFGISLKEARYMDPWQRLMIETVYLALEDAGMGGRSAYDTDTGVFIGRDHAVESSYAKMVGNVHPLVLTGSYASILASRISHTFNFQGPSIVIDTACSSALVAVHQACLALRSGQCSMAVAGGINLRENFLRSQGDPMKNILTEEAEICAFDKRSKGTLISEGIGAVLLKPLVEALKDGDPVYAIVKGSAVNNDGGVARIATPNAKSQQRVIEKCWSDAEIHPETIEYIEAHGTGTLLGDSIEVKGITHAFNNYTQRRQFCAMSTVKSNIGHTVAASGMASLMKAVLALQHRKIPQMIHFRDVNPFIDFTDSAVYVSDRMADWPKREHPRRCGVNSFGFSGTNCHVVLEEASEASFFHTSTVSNQRGPYPVVLSAREEAGLQELIYQYKQMLEYSDVSGLRVEDLSYTTLCGRGHYEMRLLLLVHSLEELYTLLSLLHERQTMNGLTEPNILYGSHRRLKYDKDNKEPGDLSIDDLHILNEQSADLLSQYANEQSTGLDQLYDFYVRGAEVDWQQLFGEGTYQKIRLPLYPLQRSKVWFDASSSELKSAREKRRDRKQRALLAEQVKEHSTEPGADQTALITEKEQILIQLWQKVLDVDLITVHDNFFSLGGDSIKMLQVLAQANELGLFFALEQMFEQQTIHELAKVVEQQSSQDVNSIVSQFALLPVEDRMRVPDGTIDAYPISSLQAGMLFHSQWSGTSEAFHNILSLHIRATLNESLFQEAVHQLVDNHPVLRTYFDFVSYSIPLQLVCQHVTVPITVDSIADLPIQVQEERLRQWRSAERSKGFDWSEAPLLRFYIHYRSEDTFQLSLVFHHAILDGWSVSAMLTELFKLYATALQGRALTILPRPTVGFQDYIAMENRVIQTQETSDYWQSKLEGATATTVLGKKITSDIQEHKYLEEKRILLDEALFNRLSKVGRENGIPIKTIFLTAHVRTLQFISGKKDVLTGVVANGRLEAPGGDKVLGLFLNTLPFRFSETGATWVEQMNEIFHTEQEMMHHRRFPLAEIQKRSGHPLTLTTVFNYNNFHIYKEMNEQDQLEVLSDEMFELTDVPLYVRFIQGRFNHEITLGLQYDPDLFTAEEIERIGRYYLQALDQLSRYPEQTIGSLLSMEEQQQLQAWNATATSLPIQDPLHVLIAEQARIKPKETALLWGQDQVTFEELEAQANQIAHALRKAGIGCGNRVGVLMKRSAQAVISMLGIWKAGAVYVPLDSEYPLHRIQLMIRDAGIKLILVHSNTNGLLSEEDINVWNVDEPDTIEKESETKAAPIQHNSADPLEDFAYIIFTSGSTGVPKGVMGTHTGLLNRCHWLWSKYPFQQDEVCCFKTSISFVDSLGEVLAPLAQGVPLLIVPAEIVGDPSHFIRTMQQYRVSRLVVVPSYLRLLLEMHPDLSSRLPHMRMCITSGEELRSTLVRLWHHTMPGRTLLNLYGSSEVSADVLYQELDQTAVNEEIIPLGAPIQNSQVYILNAEMEQVPVGVEGEIYVGGMGVAIGYWGREEWTAERFVDCSFDHKLGRLYKTGDLGLQNSEGLILFKGRKDHQVNIRGYRIELHEVELALQRHVWIKEVAVTLTSVTDEDRSLIAYMAGKEGTPPDQQEIRTFLSSLLPSYMLPDVYCYLDVLPKLPNGKLDRKALPTIKEALQMKSEADIVSSPVMDRLALLWTNTLGIAPVSSDEHFFAAGGNSLKAMRLVFMIQREFHIRLDMQEFYASPTIFAIGRLVMDKTGLLNPASGRELQPSSSEAKSTFVEELSYPLTLAQQNIWIHEQLNPNSSAYQLTMSMDVRGNLDFKALELSFNNMLKQQSALRTMISFDGTKVTQKSKSYEPYKIVLHDASEIAVDQRDEFRQQLVLAGSKKVSELESYPLFHFQGVWFGDKDYQLLLTVHHLIFDFWSVGVFVRELARQYNQWAGNYIASEGTIQTEPEKAHEYASYYEFVEWEQDLLQASAIEQRLQYWYTTLGGTLPVLKLPTDRPRSDLGFQEGARVGMQLPEQLTQELAQFAQQEETTVFTVLLSSFYALLYRYTAVHDMVIGVPVSNRHGDMQFDSLIGCCIDTLALRASFSGDVSFKELLKQVSEAFIAGYVHYRLPYGYILEKVYLNDARSASPFQYMFNFMSIQDWNVQLPGGLEVSTSMVPVPYPKYELSAEVLDTGEELWLNVEYAADLFDTQTIEMIMTDYVTLTSAMLHSPDVSIQNIPLAHETQAITSVDEPEASFDF